MEFIDDWDSQPRARIVHSGANSTSSSSPPIARASPSLPHAASCAAAAVLLLAAAYYLPPAYQVISSLFVWIAASLLLAPFAPSSATGGDVSVGRGRLLPPQEPPQESSPDPAPAPRRGRRQNTTAPPPSKSSDPIAAPVQLAASPQPPREAAAVLDSGEREEDASEWTDQDLELLRRQMVKHPAGEPQRWEKIAAAFGGRRTPESVIRAAKSGAATAAGGSFEQFLRKRKPLDPRAEAADAGGNAGGAEGGDGSWSAGDDRALLNALKEFPKDTAMRWEKVAAAVPGKTKAACMKRVTELKRDFRSTKAATEAAS
uniref:Myb-like domain-containing protein n=1 Tax=Arundo donax TaxID=35708 RepID=A0A0A9FKQ1_ARUDO